MLLSCFSRVQLCATLWTAAAAAKSLQSYPTLWNSIDTAAHQAPRSLGFSSKNTGVGCHFLLQCMKVKSKNEVTQSCPTLHDRMDCSLPGSSAHGIFQARVLEWVAMPSSRGSSLPRDRTWVSSIADRRFTVWATREATLKYERIYQILSPKVNVSKTPDALEIRE